MTTRSSPARSSAAFTLPDLPRARWCDFRIKYIEQHMTLRELADEYMCDPRTVRACLIHNKSSSSLGKKTVPTRKNRQELLPLMVLELSSVYEEDEEELMEELENANAILEGADKDRDETGGKAETDVSRDQGGSMADGSGVRQNQEESLSGDADGSWSHADSSSDGSDASWGQTESETYDTNLHAVRFSKMLQEKALACLRMYDTYLNQAQKLFPVPFHPMEEYMDTIHYHVRKHGPFYRDDYDKYLDKKLGSVNWDRLEW